MGRKEVRGAGTVLDKKLYGLEAMKADRIHWHATNIEVVNRSQWMRDRPAHGALQRIMIGSWIVKAGDSRGRTSAEEFPIYTLSPESLFTSFYLIPLLFLSFDPWKDGAMPRLWRVRSRARGHN